MTKDMYTIPEIEESIVDRFVWIMEEMAINPQIPMKAFDEVN